MDKNGQRILGMLRAFIDGSRRTPQCAGELFASIDYAFPNDRRFADVLYGLALYAKPDRKGFETEEELLEQCAVAARLVEEPSPATKP